MTIIVFLVDTSSSMNQRTYLGTSLLDTAKSSIEQFMKIRSRDPNCRWDRYMLLTFEDPPSNVKAGWKESHGTFMKELKNLEAYNLTTLGPAIKHTFDMLNTNRMQSGIDTYGQGRCPFFLEPAVIICLTDGRKMTTHTGATNELILPMNTMSMIGSELTVEPFRWDQRLYGVVLRIGSIPPNECLTYIPQADDSPINAMCEVTGGRSYAISSHRMLTQCLESLVQKCQSGVVVTFERIFPDIAAPADIVDKIENANAPWQTTRHKLIYVVRSAQRGGAVGHWPIPENYWPDIKTDTLQPRYAHPIIKFSCKPCEPVVMENLPFDKYELEASPLTQYILERKLPNLAWQVFMQNSSKYNDLGHPFGYIKASTNLTAVNLFVMPYNYPVLISLIDEVIKVHKNKPTPKWRQDFNNYISTLPAYYAAPIKRFLVRIGLQQSLNLIPDSLENCLSYSVVSYLKKIKNQAKLEYERLVASVGQCPPTCPPIRISSRTKSNNSVLKRPDFNQLLALHAGDMGALQQELLNEYDTFSIQSDPRIIDAHIYTNPFDINRKDLLSNISRMRINFLKSSVQQSRLQNTESIHCISIQEMGNYQDYLKKITPPLRELETAPARQHTFGNPFKVNKNLMIDEADEVMPGQSSASRKRTQSESSNSSLNLIRLNKKKPGPFPRNVSTTYLLSLSRPSTPIPETSSTPLGIIISSQNNIESSIPLISPNNLSSDRLIGIELEKNSTNDRTSFKASLQKSESSNSNTEKSHITSKNKKRSLSQLVSAKNSNSLPVNGLDSEQNNITADENSSDKSLSNSETNKNIKNKKLSCNQSPSSEITSNFVVNRTENTNGNIIEIDSDEEDSLVIEKLTIVISDDKQTNSFTSDRVISSIDNDENEKISINGSLKFNGGCMVGSKSKSSLLPVSKHNGFKMPLSVVDHQHNMDIRRMAILEVKKPGKNYTNLFKLLALLRGEMNIRHAHIRLIIIEANRFKKKILSSLLEKLMLSEM